MMSRLALAIEAAWYRSPGLLWILAPLEWCYAAVIALRRRLYRAGVLASGHPGVPVVVVGNITVGGTGKTPVVIALCRELLSRGLRVAVVSRGYGGKVRGVVSVARDADAACVGDESLLIARSTAASVFVGRDRLAAARAAVLSGCDVIISDDGLQHYALQRDIEVVCLEPRNVFGNGHLLPLGPLREAPRRLAYVDFVLHRNGHDPHSGTRYRALEFRSLDGSRRCGAEDHTLGSRVHAVAAIARPQRFFQTLRDLGLEVIEHPLRDHARIDAALLAELGDAPTVITGKDAVKLSGQFPGDLWVLDMELSFPEGFMTRLMEQIDRARRSTP